MRILAAGGSAADAAVAATLACCVTESVVTGLGGGGFATYYDATTRSVHCLDFFCSVPGLDGDLPAGPMCPIEIDLGGLPMSYSIGGASVAVPGVPAGTAAVHTRWGRLPWDRVVEPAINLARCGVVLPAAQALTLMSVFPALVPGAGAEIYRPGGRLLAGGDLLYHPGLDRALAILAERGPDAFYTGTVAELTVDVVRAAGGCLGPEDLAGYRVLDLDVFRAPLSGYHVFARQDLNELISTIAALPHGLAALPRPDRARELAGALCEYGRPKIGDTTNVSAVDADGNACVITLSLGIGSGVWLPGLGLHLNSMLGEGELLAGPLVPGQRMSSMMCPLVVLDEDGDLVLAAGSAGASRIRTALVHTLINVLAEGASTGEAISRPRFHVIDDVAHVEAGYPEDEIDALAGAGYKINQFDDLDHFFGAVSAVGRAGAAGDPRRGGVGLLL
ncbi:gamma-glutamyltransferase [Rugosimonospora africana]|uniref:Gamma-glutamyltransferase n=1 Tax=Rugosimonospora africana TaxID=556532 RepID=A0A8J3VN24_9ACTN|nr:gamma-glutamyltransferase [Rugosimonospora africana]